MIWFWYFALYSFGGFLLEVVYARITRSSKPDRKCFILLPLCPVYGFGALAILMAGEFLWDRPFFLAVVGGGAATAVEYLMGAFYENVLGVSFWDYSGLPLNVGGKVCLPFSLAWGVLALGQVYLIHPLVERWAAWIPSILFPAAVILVCVDGLLSAYLLKTTASTDSLKWYEAEKKTS